MKKLLLVLSLLFFSSCGINEENRRDIRLNLENGNEINLLVFEKKAYLGEERTLMIYANEHNLKEGNCGDREMKILGNEIWTEVIKRNDFPAIKAGVVYLAKRQSAAEPLYCGFFYSKKDSGEWIENNN